jgi:hypothetical protein
METENSAVSLLESGAGDGNRIDFPISKPMQDKALTTAPKVNWCQLVPGFTLPSLPEIAALLRLAHLSDGVGSILKADSQTVRVHVNYFRLSYYGALRVDLYAHTD